MKRTKVLCPLCNKTFDPRTPLIHIKKYHPEASDYALARIRDARRSCFGKSKPVKHKSPFFAFFPMKVSKT